MVLYKICSTLYALNQTLKESAWSPFASHKYHLTHKMIVMEVTGDIIVEVPISIEIIEGIPIEACISRIKEMQIIIE